MTEPEWGDFKIMLALGRGGSVAGAARILGVDGSTISRRLAAAEKALGAVLIVRGAREFAFTAEGKAALEAAETMDAAANSATAAVRAARTDLQGVVRISLSPSLFHFLQPFPQIVANKFPALLVELGSNRAAVDLAKGEADIAIRVSRPMDLDLIVRHTFEMGLAAYASKTYLGKHGRISSEEDLRHHKLVLYHDKFSANPFAIWIEQWADKTKPVMRVDSIDMAHSMIATDHGVGVLWCCHGDQLAELERVLPEPVSSNTLHVIYHESMRGSARMKAVVDLLISHLVDHRFQLSGKTADI